MEYYNINEKNKKLQRKLEEILPENLRDFVGEECKQNENVMWEKWENRLEAVNLISTNY